MMNGFSLILTAGKSAGVKARNDENALLRTNSAISFEV